jgi:uncharacterized membrane protein HdeD (DUF308 family)
LSTSTVTTAISGGNLKTMGIVAIVMGVLAIMAPLFTGLSVVVMVGIMVLIAGVTRMIWAFGAGSLGTRAFQLLIGGLTLLCGLAMVTDPIFASGVLTVILAIYLVVDGVVEISVAFGMRPGRGWGLLLAGGIISLLLGLMIWRQFPLSGAWALGIFLGVKLLLVGMTMLAVGKSVRP